MKQITITREDFHKALMVAVEKVTEHVAKTMDEPMAVFIIPMVGMKFSKEVEAALFDEEPK